ncbi:MAG: transposase [Deltaproteobacteria bacterium]|nr:transposase [Deltaproteobacteria bacterium]
MQLSDFAVTADGRQVLACITDQIPLTSEVTGDGQVVAIFSHASCSRCRFLSVCRVKRYQGNYRLVYALADWATSRRREQQETAHFKERYKIRSGIEATISEANRLTGLKRVWTRGKKRVRMSVFFKALAINIKRFIRYALEKAKKALLRHPGGLKGSWPPYRYALPA